MGNVRYTDTRSLLLPSVFIWFCLFSGVLTQTPTLNLDISDSINGNCTINSEDLVTLEGSVNLSEVAVNEWSNVVEFVIQSSDGPLVFCQANLSNCSSLSQLGCYCKEGNESFYTVVFNQTATIQYSGNIIQARLRALDFVTNVTSTETLYPSISDIIDASLSFGAHSEFLPSNESLLNIPIDDQEVRFTVSGLREPFTITVITPNMSSEYTNQREVVMQLNESMGYVILSYEEHAACQRKSLYFYTLKDVWRQDPELYFISSFSETSSCVKNGQDIGVLEAIADFTGIDESLWFMSIFIFVGAETMPTCIALLGRCSPDLYPDNNCYCKERHGHLYTVIFNQSATVLFSEEEVTLRTYAYLLNGTVLTLESNGSITYPYVNRPLTVILGYGKDAQYPPVNNSEVYLPDDEQLLDFTAEGMRHPSSISYKLSSPDLGMVFSNQTTVNITVYDSTNYITISYQEELYCKRGATYQFTLKAVSKFEPILGISSLMSESQCPMAGKDAVTIEGVIDFTGVDYSEWILDVRFFTATNLTVCEAPLLNCGETNSTTCYCKSHQRDVYTVVFSDKADPALSLQMIHLEARRTNFTTIEAAEAIKYSFVEQGVNVTMAYGNETQSPPINNSMIYIPDESQFIQFTVDGIHNHSSISYKLSSPDHGWTFVNQSNVRIRVYDSTNYISIWYEEEGGCQRSATYHFALKDVVKQDPALSISPVTSDKECVIDGESMVTFNAEVDFTGVDYSQWILTLNFLSPATTFTLCPVSTPSCGETSRDFCYCESHVRDVYSLVFNSTANIIHSSQPVYLQATRIDYSTLRTKETIEYPFVNRDINVTMTYGNQTQSPPINDSIIHVPNDNQVIQITVYGMRHPSSIGYKLSTPDQGSEFENKSSVNITVYDSTNYITIWYEEKDFCQRSATYTFILKVVNRQDPTLSVGAVSSSDECVIAGESTFTSEAMVNFSGVDYSQWNLTAHFFTETITSTLCGVSLLECMGEPSAGCYCKSHTRDVYTVVFQDTADLALSLQPVDLHFGLTRTNGSVTEADETQQFPLIAQIINVTMVYGNETRSPPINNSVIYIPDDSPVIQLTVDSLKHPSYIRYNLSTQDDVQEFVNQSSINITVYNNTKDIIVWYEETRFCQRSAIYHFSLKVVSKEEPALYFNSLTVNRPCIIHGEDRVTVEAIVDFTGVDDSKWMPFVTFFTPSNLLSCTVSLMDCSELQNTSCYCKGNNDDNFILVFNHTGDVALSLQPIHLSLNRTNFSKLEANGTHEYPLVSERIEVSVTIGNHTQSPPVNNNRLFIPLDDQQVQFTVTGLSPPYSINYITSTMSEEMALFNQSSVLISVNESNTYLNISYAEDMYCKRRKDYYFPLKATWRADPHVVTGALAAKDVSCPISNKDFITLEPTVNFTGVNDSQWLYSLAFVSPISNGSNDEICRVSLTECQQTSPKMCYCKDRTEEIYTVVFNSIANLSLSGRQIQLMTYKRDASPVQASEALKFPIISDDIEIAFKYAHQAPKPFVNNSVQEIYGDHSSVRFTVTGLSLPFTIEYKTSAVPGNVTSMDNQGTVTIPVSETTITLTYEEKQHCQRKNTYILTMEDSSSDDLSTAAIVGIILGGLVFLILLIAIATAIFNNNCIFKTQKQRTYATSARYSGRDAHSTKL